MQQLFTPESFEFFARYLLSGFIIILVRSKFVVANRPKPMEVFIEAIIFSFINQFVFFVLALTGEFLFSVSFESKDLFYLSRVPFYLSQVQFFLEILILPAVLGVLFGKNLARGWNHGMLRRLSMPIEHPTKRAYDYAFTHQRPPGFVIISFEDDTVVRGYFGENSLAASDSNRSDIFLERLYKVDENGNWQDNHGSAVVNLSGFRSIEFLHDQEA